MTEMFSTPGIAVAAISAVTALVTSVAQYIINYKPNKKIDKLAKDVQTIDCQLREQASIISYYAAERSVIMRLNGVRNHAVAYASNEFQRSMINEATQDISNFILDIIKNDIDLVPQDILMLKVSNLKNIAMEFLSETEWSAVTDNIVRDVLTYISIFSDNLLAIKKDTINNKISRIINKGEDLLQEVSRIAIIAGGMNNEESKEKSTNQ